MTGDPREEQDDPDPGVMGEVMRASAASLYELLLWFADHEMDDVSQLRWRTEAHEVVCRCARAYAASPREQHDLFVDFMRREDELVGLDW